MPPKTKKKSAQTRAPGVTFRNGVAYWQRTHERLSGGRAYKSLETRDPDLANSYAGALNTLMDRGDWGVIDRWTEGHTHITDIARAVREGDYASLRRLNMKGVSLRETIEAFLGRAEATLSPKRTAQLRSMLSGLVAFLCEDDGDFMMHEMTRDRCETFLHEPKESIGGVPWSAGSQSEARTICGSLWTYAIEKETEEAAQSEGALVVSIGANPWKKARVPKKRKTRFAFCTPAEAADVLGHPDIIDLPRRAFMAIGFFAGLRDAEIRNLRTSVDVNLQRGEITVQPRAGEYEWMTKTDASVRTIPIPEGLVRIIRRHVELGFAGDRYLFIMPGADRPISDNTARKWARLAYEAAGLRYGRKEGDSLTLHSTRHSYATWMLSGGVTLPTAARRLGDTQEQVLKTYAHAMPIDESRANDVIAAAAEGIAK